MPDFNFTTMPIFILKGNHMFQVAELPTHSLAIICSSFFVGAGEGVGCASWLAGSQVPSQGLKPAHGSESTESQPADPQRTS